MISLSFPKFFWILSLLPTYQLSQKKKNPPPSTTKPKQNQTIQYNKPPLKPGNKRNHTQKKDKGKIFKL